jgi:hypothetical protein
MPVIAALAKAAKGLSLPVIGNPTAMEHGLELVAGKLRVAARNRKGSHVDEPLDPGILQ